MKQRALWVFSLLMVLGIALSLQTWMFISKAKTAWGTVESVATVSQPGQGFPVMIGFKDSQGEMRHFKTLTRFKLGSPILKEGKSVEVIYNPADPEKTARINSFIRVWLWPALCCLGAIGMLIVAAG